MMNFCSEMMNLTRSPIETTPIGRPPSITGSHDDEIERISLTQGRIVLTRDREILERRTISHGCYVRAVHTQPQLREVFDRLGM